MNDLESAMADTLSGDAYGHAEPPLSIKHARLISKQRDEVEEHAAACRARMDELNARIAALTDERDAVVAEINHADATREQLGHAIISLGELAKALPKMKPPENPPAKRRAEAPRDTP